MYTCEHVCDNRCVMWMCVCSDVGAVPVGVERDVLGAGEVGAQAHAAPRQRPAARRALRARGDSVIFRYLLLLLFNFFMKLHALSRVQEDGSVGMLRHSVKHTDFSRYYVFSGGTRSHALSCYQNAEMKI